MAIEENADQFCLRVRKNIIWTTNELYGNARYSFHRVGWRRLKNQLDGSSWKPSDERRSVKGKEGTVINSRLANDSLLTNHKSWRHIVEPGGATFIQSQP